MAAASFDHPQAIAAALRVLDRHVAALNSGDAAALARTLHFPHYRLAGGRMQIWERLDNYLEDFHARAGNEWHHSAWDFRKPIGSGSDKVHLGACPDYRRWYDVTKVGRAWAARNEGVLGLLSCRGGHRGRRGQPQPL